MVATLTGIIVFSEPLTLTSALGVLLILAAVVILNITPKHESMKKFALLTLATMLLCSCGGSKSKITAETAYQGVSNYCHSAYDWSAAEENPDIMGLKMGEETDTEYQVVFRSYTGALVYFYVDKNSGTTRMVEYVPALDITEETEKFNIFDHIKR